MQDHSRADYNHACLFFYNSNTFRYLAYFAQQTSERKEYLTWLKDCIQKKQNNEQVFMCEELIAYIIAFNGLISVPRQKQIKKGIADTLMELTGIEIKCLMALSQKYLDHKTGKTFE